MFVYFCADWNARNWNASIIWEELQVSIFNVKTLSQKGSLPNDLLENAWIFQPRILIPHSTCFIDP